jgi:hypothetical protein
MSFGKKHPQRNRIDRMSARASQELCAKSLPLLAVFAPAEAEETIPMGIMAERKGFEPSIRVYPV